MKKYFRLILIFIFLIVLFIKLKFIYQLTNDISLIGIFVAYVVGISSIFKNEIINWVFRPILVPCVKILETVTTEGIKVKYYNLNIKNNGFISTKNIRAKIKSDKEKEWLSLTRPFSQSIFINQLSSQEEEDFNIGSIYINQNLFKITTNIEANNQKLLISNNEEQQYILQIISDNTSPFSFKIHVNNQGYDYKNLISIIN